MPATAHTVRANPPLSGSELVRGVALGAWVLICDVALKVAARVGGCAEPIPLADALEQLWAPLVDCRGTQLAGPSILLRPEVRDGSLFGSMPGSFGGPTGQIYGLGLLAFGTIIAVLILRWRWRTSGDALALGAVWGGLLAHAAPRLAGAGGTAFSELWAFGLTTGVADLAILWGLGWLVWRFVAEVLA